MSITTTTRPSNAAATAASSRLRQERAQIRSGVRAGEIELADLLLTCPQVLHGLRVFEVVQYSVMHRSDVGGRRRLELLSVAAAEARVNLFREVQRLSPRQRDWLADWLREHPYQRPRRSLTARA